MDASIHKAYLSLAIAICMTSPIASAQTQDAAASSTAHAPSQTTGAERTAAPQTPSSAFGKVMAVLTDLLQEAATRQAGGVARDAGPSLPADNSALTITVTPVEGRTTFTVSDGGKDPTAPVDGDPATDVQIDIERAQLAVQGEDGAG